MVHVRVWALQPRTAGFVAILMPRDQDVKSMQVPRTSVPGHTVFVLSALPNTTGHLSPGPVLFLCRQESLQSAEEYDSR